MVISSLDKYFSSPGGLLTVFRNFSIEFRDQEISVVVGPSGCGKTTLLNILAGFMKSDGGSISGRPEQVSYLFQEPRLLPWRTVERNTRLVLEAHIPDIGEQKKAVRHYLELVGLETFADHYPHELSGGMRQRAAIARAFACPSSLLLMDEPFQALDLDLRISLVKAFTRLWEEEPKTTVFVTHDIQEALMIADTITVFSHRPAQTMAAISVPVPRSDRSLDDPVLADIEQKVISLLLKKY